jgi:Ca2+-binding RTX toxin-like protein
MIEDKEKKRSIHREWLSTFLFAALLATTNTTLLLAAPVAFTPVDAQKTVFTCNGLTATIVIKHVRNEVIFGMQGDDVIVALGGNNDIISGRDGNDTICGGSGDDVINGGNGNDTIFGGNGNDRILGGNHTDFLYGGPQDDVLIPGAVGSALTTFDGGRGIDECLGDPQLEVNCEL